jgi:hypothetical protein
MAVIKPQYGTNLNPKDPLPPKDKVIAAAVIVVFLAGMFALVGWLIGFNKVSAAVFTAVFLVVVTFLLVGIGWGIRKLFGLVRK